MNSTKTKTTVVIGTVLALIVGTMVILKGKPAHADELKKEPQAASLNTAVEKINEANVGLPDLQVQGKTLIFAAMTQKKIPAAANWCETLNVADKIWPVTPTNTVFALNTAVAGHIYSKTNRPATDVVVFFETATPGWNQTGGAELLAHRPEGVAVALADGRAMLMRPAEAAKLRWNP
jgi:hypothetical protein